MKPYYTHQQGIDTPFNDMVCFLLRAVEDPTDVVFVKQLRHINRFGDLTTADKFAIIELLDCYEYFDCPGDQNITLSEVLEGVRNAMKGGDA
ncbi:MAG: hypothetical protein DHS20C08_04410 [Rhodomicrobium sp.]|nr:MAG: hypothetical protein DHS20C08_04410 [Rhodomicrobium sp.]